MKTMPYRTTVIESLHLLENVRNQVLTQIVNIAAYGEMKNVLDAFEEGDYYTFDIEQFEDSQDLNIMKLMNLCKNIEIVYESMLNVNAVRGDELISK